MCWRGADVLLGLIESRALFFSCRKTLAVRSKKPAGRNLEPNSCFARLLPCKHSTNQCLLVRLLCMLLIKIPAHCAAPPNLPNAQAWAADVWQASGASAVAAALLSSSYPHTNHLHSSPPSLVRHEDLHSPPHPLEQHHDLHLPHAFTMTLSRMCCRAPGHQGGKSH